MKTIFTTIALSFLCLNYAQTGNLTVTFTKINSKKGEIYVGAFTENGFLIQPKASQVLESTENGKQVTFKDLEYGTYAVTAFQDLNANEKLDMDEYGRPTEPWTISGPPNSLMPIWSESKFEFNSKTKTIKLKI